MSSNIHFFKTPLGEEMVILPRAEFEALASHSTLSDDDEDAADLAIYRERKAALDRGDDVGLPAEVSERIMRGASRLRAIRQWRGINQSSLAHRAGIGQGYLSDIENRRKSGAPDTMRRLADALDVPQAWVV